MKSINPLIAFAAGLALIASAWLFSTCGRRSDTGEKIPPKTQRALDSLAADAATFHARADSLLRMVGTDTIRLTRTLTRVDTVTRHAEILEGRADSLARLGAYEAAYRSEHLANDTLHVVIDSLYAALGIERATRTRLLTLYAADTLRRVAVERINTELQTAIGRLERPCRIVGPIPCPSRTVTFVVAALGTGAAVIFLTR